MFHLPPEEINYRETRKKALFEVLKTLDSSKIKIPQLAEGDLNFWYEKIEFNWLPKNSRRRVSLHIDLHHNLGFFAPKSHQLQTVLSYDLAEDAVNAIIAPLSKLVKTLEAGLLSKAVITSFENGVDLFLICKKRPKQLQLRKIFDFAQRHNLNCSYCFERLVLPVLILRKNLVQVGKIKLEVASDVFLQATKSGLSAIISRLEAQIREQNFLPKKIADLYAGFGTYSFALQSLRNETSDLQFVAFEGDKNMVEIARRNAVEMGLNAKIIAKCRDIATTALLAKELQEFDAAIINPPRIGAAPQIYEIAKSTLPVLHYVSCNPQSFVRDAAILLKNGFFLENLSAIDQFHSTSHLELVALFSRACLKIS